MNKKKSKAAKDLMPKEKRDIILKAHAIIHETIRFWEARMDLIDQEMQEIESMPDWMPDKEVSYDSLVKEMQLVVCKLAVEEREIEKLEQDTNELLAEILFNKISFKKVDDKKSQED